MFGLQRYFYLLVGFAMAVALVSCNSDDDDSDPTVSDILLNDDTSAGDDDSPAGDDDTVEDETPISETPEVQSTIPGCTWVAGDVGGVVIGKEKGAVLVPNRFPLMSYAFTLDVEILADEKTVFEVFEYKDEAELKRELYVSRDSGCIFDRVAELPGQDFRALTLDRVDPEAVYLTSDLSDQLIYSLDAGMSWDSIMLPASGVLAFAADGIEHLAFVSPEPALYTSVDGGKSWDKHVVELTGSSVAQNAAFHPTDIGTVIVGTDMSGWYRTEDGGQSWTWLSEGMYEAVEEPGEVSLYSIDIAYSRAEPLVVYGVLNRLPSGGGEAYRSEDGGVTWLRIDNRITSGEAMNVGTDMRIYPDPVDASFFYAWYGTYYGGYGTDLYIAQMVGDELDVQLRHYDFYDLGAMAFHPLDSTILYLGTVNDYPLE